MPFELELEKQFKTLWKIKIFDKERLEPPHATIIRSGTKEKWRWDLREKKIMDKQPNPKDIPKKIIDTLMSKKAHKKLVKAWDQMFSHNPVWSVRPQKNKGTAQRIRKQKIK